MSIINKCEMANGNCTIDHTLYWDAIYSQGHVSNLILLYAIGGEKYDNVRFDLTLCHLNYVLDHEEAFSDWKDAYWLEDVFFEYPSMKILLPMILKWLKNELPEEQAIRYQQILPFYLFLGDYTKVPEGRIEQRMSMNGLISGTIYFGDTSWKGVYYDISRSRSIFRSMVERADYMFARDEMMNKKKFNWLSIFGLRKNRPDESIYCKVGNWLAFCAYITLLSKYQRYSLNAEGFKDAKPFIGAVATQYMHKLRELIG